jgi:hypothetical protein
MWDLKGCTLKVNGFIFTNSINLLIRHSWKQYTKSGNCHLTMNVLHLIGVTPLFPSLHQLGHSFILDDAHWRVSLMSEFMSNVWYIQTLRYAAQWSFLNEAVFFLVLGPTTWWSQMLCIWRYGWWPGDYVHPELATLMLDSIVSSWMENLSWFSLVTPNVGSAPWLCCDHFLSRSFPIDQSSLPFNTVQSKLLIVL